MTAAPQYQNRFETIKNLGFAAIGLGVVLAYGLSSGSFVFPKWLFFFLLAVSTSCALVVHVFRHRRLSLDEIDAVVLAFGAYCGLSLLWSPDPGSGFVGLFYYSIAATVFLGLRRVHPERLSVLLPFIFIASSAVVLLRIAMSEERYGGFGNESFVAEYLLLSLPFVAAWWATRDTWERWLAPVVICVVLAYLLGFREYTFSKIVFIGGPVLAVTCALVAARGWLTRQRLTKIMIASLPLVAGFVTYGWQRPGTWVSLQTRLELTYNTMMMWFEQPLFGHGAGSFNYVYPRFMQSYQDAFPNTAFNTITEMLNFAGAAHNEPAQLLSDYGVVGLGLLVLFGLLLVKAVGSLQDKSALTYAALCHLATAAIVSGITFVFQNPATLFISMCALAVVLNRHDKLVAAGVPARSFKLGWLGSLPLAAVVLLTTLVAATVMVRSYISHWHFASATRLLLKEPARAFELNQRAYLAFPSAPEPRRQLFITFMQWLESEQLGPGDPIPYDIEAQDKIFEISASTGPQSPGLMLPRIYHFLLTNREIDHAEEIERLFTDLKARTPRLPDIYIVEALVGLRTRDYDRVERAIENAERWVPTQDPELQKFQNAKVKALKEELTRQAGIGPE